MMKLVKLKLYIKTALKKNAQMMRILPLILRNITDYCKEHPYIAADSVIKLASLTIYIVYQKGSFIYFHGKPDNKLVDVVPYERLQAKANALLEIPRRMDNICYYNPEENVYDVII